MLYKNILSKKSQKPWHQKECKRVSLEAEPFTKEREYKELLW